MRCRRSNPRNHRTAGPHRQTGAAMVVAMLVFAMAAILVVAMKGEFQRYYQRTTNVLFAEQAHAYLRGGEDLAALVLMRDWDEDKLEPGGGRDDLTEFWAQQYPPNPLDNGAIMTAQPLEDLQGRFNLNSLVSANTTGGESGREESFSREQKQFIRLLQTFEEPEISEYEAKIITRSVIDWIDSDNSTSPDGAEDDYYGSLTPAYRAGNAPMSSISELRAVANITPEIYAALAPLVTVWPTVPQPINIHTARPEILRTFNDENDLTPLTAVDVEELVEMQTTEGFQDANEFWDQPAFSGKNARGAAITGEDSNYFLFVATVTLADKNMHLYSVLERRNRQVKALVRASGSL